MTWASFLELNLKVAHRMDRILDNDLRELRHAIENCYDTDGHYEQPKGLTIIPFDPKSLENFGPPSRDETKKRRLASDEDKANMRAVKSNGPCLRCKILKKQCNDERPCKQCPRQDDASVKDHWKVLGCHTSLVALAKMCIPARLEKNERNLRDSGGRFRTIYIQHLEHNHSKRLKKAEVDRIILINSSFRALTDECWKCRSKISMSFGPRGPSRVRTTNISPKYNWEAAWELVKVSTIDPRQMVETAYNPFTLFRNIAHPDLRAQSGSTRPRHILSLAEDLLMGACATYQREHQCQSLISTFSPCDANSGRLVLTTEYSSIMSEQLEFYLSDFQDICCKRRGLTPWQWVATFYSLCLMSIVQSILLDSACVLAEAEEACLWKPSDIIKIRSLYKALIGIFCWAQGSSDLLCEDLVVTHFGNFDQIFSDLKEMIQYDKWKDRGIGSTKDFLLGLGQGFFDGGAFNGFFNQKWLYSAEASTHRKATLPNYIPRGGSRLSLQDALAESSISMMEIASSLPKTSNISYKIPTNSTTHMRISGKSAKGSPADFLKGALYSLRSGGSITSQMKEELMLLGVSLESLGTPSSHSSSLRRLEQNLSQVFDCCGETISTIDDLLEHYETHHSQPIKVDSVAYNENDLQENPKACSRASPSVVTDEWFELETSMEYKEELINL